MEKNQKTEGLAPRIRKLFLNPGKARMIARAANNYAYDENKAYMKEYLKLKNQLSQLKESLNRNGNSNETKKGKQRRINEANSRIREIEKKMAIISEKVKKRRELIRKEGPRAVQLYLKKGITTESIVKNEQRGTYQGRKKELAKIIAKRRKLGITRKKTKNPPFKRFRLH